jgi:hypothetical protein
MTIQVRQVTYMCIQDIKHERGYDMCGMYMLYAPVKSVSARTQLHTR